MLSKWHECFVEDNEKGGGSKNKITFFHCCDARAENMHAPNDAVYDSCTELMNNNAECENKLSCCCKEMMTEKHRKLAQDEHDNVMKNIDSFSEDVCKSSKLKLIKNDVSEAKSYPRSVDFDPKSCLSSISY